MRGEIIAPYEYDSMVRELRENEKLKDELKQKREGSRRKIEHIEILIDAHDPFLDVKNDKENLDNISIPQNIPHDMKGKYEVASNELTRLDEELTRLRNELEDLERKRDNISFSKELINEGTVLKTLFSEVKRIEV